MINYITTERLKSAANQIESALKEISEQEKNRYIACRDTIIEYCECFETGGERKVSNFKKWVENRIKEVKK